MNKRESVVSDGGFNIVDVHDYLLTAKPIMSMGRYVSYLILWGSGLRKVFTMACR